MIDFAHVAVQGGDEYEEIDWEKPDDNYMHGLENLLKMLKDLRDETPSAEKMGLC